MKFQVIQQTYDYQNKVSHIIGETKLGYFHGFSTKLPEDPFSEFTGYECAEWKAKIKALKAERAELKEKLHILQNCYNAVASCKGINEASIEMKKFRKQLGIVKRDISRINAQIDTYYTELQKTILVRDVANKKRFNKE